MLPDKTEWANEFVRSKKYQDIVDKINLFPEPEFLPTWDQRKSFQKIPGRRRIYLYKMLPLQAFYIIDYIDKQTNGGNIVNITSDYNLFAGMYNITDWLGHNTYYTLSGTTLLNIIDLKTVMENSISIVDECRPGFSKIEKVLFDAGHKTKNYCYVALDSVNMLRATSKEFIADQQLDKYYKRMLFVDDIVDNLSEKYEIVLYENLMEDDMHESVDPFDGDIRILFKPKTSKEV